MAGRLSLNQAALPGAGVVPAPAPARGGSGTFAGLLAAAQTAPAEAADPAQQARPFGAPPQGAPPPATPEVPTPPTKPAAPKSGQPGASQPQSPTEAAVAPPAVTVEQPPPLPPTVEAAAQPAPASAKPPGPPPPVSLPAEVPAAPIVATHRPAPAPRGAPAAPTRGSEKKPAKSDTTAAEPQLQLQPQTLPEQQPPPAVGALPPSTSQAGSTSENAAPTHVAGVAGVGGPPAGVTAPITEKPTPPAPTVSSETISASAAAAMPQHSASVQSTEPAKPSAAGLPHAIAEAGATIAARIGRAVEDGTHVLTVALHPAELGRVELRLAFHSSGVDVQMTMSRPETFDAFTRNRGAMEQHLSDAGINLAGGGLDMRFGQQPDRAMPPPTPVRLAVPADPTTASLQSQPRSVANGLVDILA